MHFEIKTDTDYNFLKSRESRFKSITVTFSDRLPFGHAYFLQPYHSVHIKLAEKLADLLRSVTNLGQKLKQLQLKNENALSHKTKLQLV